MVSGSISQGCLSGSSRSSEVKFRSCESQEAEHPGGTPRKPGWGSAEGRGKHRGKFAFCHRFFSLVLKVITFRSQ